MWLEALFKDFFPFLAQQTICRVGGWPKIKGLLKTNKNWHPPASLGVSDSMLEPSHAHLMELRAQGGPKDIGVTMKQGEGLVSF